MDALVFIGLVMADTYLTNRVLALGATELNPLASLVGLNIAVRLLIAVCIILALYWFNKEKLLWLVNLILFSVVFWNLTLNLLV